MQTVLITGANRGIGLEFTRQYLDDGWQVLACCRDPKKADALNGLAADHEALEMVPLDVSDMASVSKAANALEGRAIDLLINNAGIFGPRDRAALGDVDYDGWAEVMDVNVMGPMRVAGAFAANLALSTHPVLATISSKMGSMGANVSGGNYIYRSSKAAVNAVVKCLSLDLGPKGVIVAAFHPGWVQTDMGGGAADITVEESVTGMRRVIAGLKAQDNGGFFNYDGAPLPW
jgi:NAD(P)-dependent dehydrogenase (short-subunit alcohol dehydrogenase family)